MSARSIFSLAISACLLAACARPAAKFSLKGDKNALEPIEFDNQSENADQYSWDFGDGHTSGAASPTHRYQSSGSYQVRLQATDEKSRSRTVERTVRIAPPKACLVEIQTKYGNMIAKLYDATPQHQDNFTKLAQEGFYDSLLFHRVIEHFMIQGGDPNSKGADPKAALGSGGPGYTLPAEFVDSLVHIKGALSAARTGDAVNPEKRSSGSQFYIVDGQPIDEAALARIESNKGIRYSSQQREAYLEQGGAPFLDGDYTVFGQVIEGLEVIDKLAAVPTDGRDRPLEDLMILKVRLIR